jgi:hypothetical protein
MRLREATFRKLTDAEFAPPGENFDDCYSMEQEEERNSKQNGLFLTECLLLLIYFLF